jgi:hypothetical protein
MSESSIEDLVEEFLPSLVACEKTGDSGDLVSIIYLAHTIGYHRGFTDATEESNGASNESIAKT